MLESVLAVKRAVSLLWQAYALPLIPHQSSTMVTFSSPILVTGTASVPPRPRDVRSRSRPCMCFMN